MDELPDHADTGLRPDQALASKQGTDRIEALIADLPERQRIAITLCAIESMGNIEAAEVMQVSVEALESLLSRARRSLRTRLALEPAL